LVTLIASDLDVGGKRGQILIHRRHNDNGVSGDTD
jgi:hypothetical protein